VIMPITPTPKVWMDGSLVDWEDATVHVLTHSLHYGTAVFEGIRAYSAGDGAAVFRLQEHIARLFRSAHLLGIEIPYEEAELCEAVRKTVSSSGLESCYIRPLVYLGYGEMGLNPLLSQAHVAIAVWQWASYLGAEGIKKGIRVKVSSWARHDPRSMPTASKATGMYINSSLAKVEAVRAGYDEAIMCTTDGYLAEGSGENLFLVRNGYLLTPAISATGVLAGVTADSVTTIARDLGYSVKEELLRRPDLYLADEAFLTGTAAEIVPVVAADDRTIGSGEPGPITRAIQDAFFATIRGEVGQYKDWLDHVNR